MAGPTSKTHLSHSILYVNFDERGLRPSRISLRFLQYHSVEARSTMLIKMQHFFERGLRLLRPECCRSGGRHLAYERANHPTKREHLAGIDGFIHDSRDKLLEDSTATNAPRDEIV